MRQSVVIDRVAIADLARDQTKSSIMPIVKAYRYVVASEPDSHTRILRSIPHIRERYISPSWEDWNNLLSIAERSDLIERPKATNAWAKYNSQ